MLCSIRRHLAPRDGPSRATLSTTSCVALEIQESNGFEFTYQARGSLSQNPCWDRLRMTRPPIVSGAGSTTLKCAGLVTAREAPLRTPSPCRSPTRPFTHGNIETGTPEDTNDLAIHTRAWDRLISCTLDCHPHRHPRFQMVVGVLLHLQWATILTLTGTSDIGHWHLSRLQL